MANETKTDDITEFITEYNKRTLLPIVKHGMILHKLADKEPMPKGEGTSVVFRRTLPLEPVDRNKCKACGLKGCIYRKRKTNRHG